MCCDVCYKEFKGWCQSFTRTEKALAILEAVLLVVLVVFLIFLILHLLACSTPEPRYEEPKEEIEESEEYEFEEVEDSAVATTKHTTRPTTTKKKTTTATRTTTSTTTSSVQQTASRVTIEPGLECSWTPSAKTSAFTHYYENSGAQTTGTTFTKFNAFTKKPKTAKRVATKKEHKKFDTKLEYNVDFIQVDQSDEEVADNLQTRQVLSLVKLKPPQGVVFGCILTIISEFYVLTSASCIEAIEEVDSLDSFVIMEQYGTSSNGKIHSILDLQIHPFYQGINKSYDLAVIKSESSFVNGQAVQLQTPLDYSMTTIGERFHILGFGSYRSIDKSSAGRSLHRGFVYRLPASQCPGAAAWALRHLAPGRAAPPASAPGARSLCAGALYARGLPCNYCSGTPLLRGKVLVGLMSENQQCGVACEPQLYVNIVALREWIDSVLKGE